ncbi:MAG: hypothetical protein ACR2PT_06760 [Endozoicomonas sp.]
MKKKITPLLLSAAVVLSALCGLSSADTNLEVYKEPAAGTELQVFDAESRDNQIAKSYYPYALTSYLAHKHKLTTGKDNHANPAVEERLALHGYRNITATELPPSWRVKNKGGVYEAKNGTHRIYDKNGTNLYGRVFINDDSNKIIIAFAGTEFNPQKYGWRIASTLSTSFMAAFASIFANGKDIAMMTKAVKVTKDIANQFPGYQVELSGSSLGGAIAQFVSLETGYSARVFNSLALNNTILEHFKLWHPDHNPETLISHVYLAGELLNDSYDLTSYLVQGKMPVKGYKLDVPSEVSAQIDGYLTGWSRHWAGSVLKVMEYHLDPVKQLPKL